MATPAICYSASEVAAVTGLSLSMVRKLTKNGVIPHVKVGRRILYPLTGIEGWLNENTVYKGKEDDKNG